MYYSQLFPLSIPSAKSILTITKLLQLLITIKLVSRLLLLWSKWEPLCSEQRGTVQVPTVPLCSEHKGSSLISWRMTGNLSSSLSVLRASGFNPSQALSSRKPARMTLWCLHWQVSVNKANRNCSACCRRLCALNPKDVVFISLCLSGDNEIRSQYWHNIY